MTYVENKEFEIAARERVIVSRDSYPVASIGREWIGSHLEGKERPAGMFLQGLWTMKRLPRVTLDRIHLAFYKEELECLEGLGDSTLGGLLAIPLEKFRGASASEKIEIRLVRILEDVAVGPEGWLMHFILRQEIKPISNQADSARRVGIAELIESLRDPLEREVLTLYFGLENGIVAGFKEIRDILNTEVNRKGVNITSVRGRALAKLSRSEEIKRLGIFLPYEPDTFGVCLGMTCPYDLFNILERHGYTVISDLDIGREAHSELDRGGLLEFPLTTLLTWNVKLSGLSRDTLSEITKAFSGISSEEEVLK